MIVDHNYYEQSPEYIEELEKETDTKGYSLGVAGNGKKSLFVDWKPRKEDIFASSDGKLLVMSFDKFAGHERFGVYNKFSVKKSSYEKQMDLMCHYINFYTTFYDTDREFITGYLKVKYELDNCKRFGPDSAPAFLDFLYEMIITPKFVARITRMVNDCYIDDIEGETNGRGKYIKNVEVKHLESLEFTNQHVKVLLKISHTMKLISPLIFQYAYLNNIKLDKSNDLIYQAYRPLFDIMTENVNIYNKLVVYVRAKVLESKAHNPSMFDQREIFGVDEAILMGDLTKKVLIVNNIFKLMFPCKWSEKENKFRENVVGFLKVVLKFQLVYFIKLQLEQTLTEVTNSSNDDGLSNMDKMKNILNKLNEGLVVISEANSHQTIEFVRKNNDITITDDEIEYYRRYLSPSPYQSRLVTSFWNRQFGSYRDSYNWTRKEYIFLMLMMKKILLIKSGCSPDSVYTGRSVLPFIISGNTMSLPNMKVIRNSKFIAKVEESSAYRELMDHKYNYLEEIQPCAILNDISMLINTQFSIVSYEDQGSLGRPIEYNEDILADEMIAYFNMI